MADIAVTPAPRMSMRLSEADGREIVVARIGFVLALRATIWAMAR